MGKWVPLTPLYLLLYFDFVVFLMTKNWDVNKSHKDWDEVHTISPAAGLKDHQQEEW